MSITTSSGSVSQTSLSTLASSVPTTWRPTYSRSPLHALSTSTSAACLEWRPWIRWRCGCRIVGGVLMLQSVVHDERDGEAGRHTWWCKCRVHFFLSSSWTLVYYCFGRCQCLAWCTKHYYTTFLFTTVCLYTGSGH